MLNTLFNKLFGQSAASKPAAQAAGPLLTRNDPNAKFHSRFGGLWVDRLDAEQVLAEKLKTDPNVAEQEALIRAFMQNGFVILPGAVSHEQIDRYRAELQAQIDSGNSPIKVSVPVVGPQDKDVIPLHEADILTPLSKILDTYQYIDSAIPMIFNDKVTRFLRAVFEDDIWAFQGLHFERGSTQAVHQDTAYVVSENPLHVCASWLALEDVQPGSGELMYYVGSHRNPDWVYSEKYKHYNHERDAHEQHMGHLEYLHKVSQERGLPLEHFLPKKGDVLIWSADLAHGGSQIVDPSLTRRSLVTHFSPASSEPYYMRFKNPLERQKREVVPGGFTSTLYYPNR